MQPRKLLFMLKLIVLLCLLGTVTPIAYAQTEITTATMDSEAANVVDAKTIATELLVYDLNRVVTVKDRGFPRDQPPRSSANGNWYTPVNFAEGTLYFRVAIRRQPQPQPMQLQFCVWQDKFALENCGALQSLTGNAGTVVTWSQGVGQMWKKDGRSIDWSRARMRYGIAVKNRYGLPVSSVKGWNWNGENPALWYPMDMRFTVVVVAKGATFSGWGNYVSSSNTISAAAVADATAATDENAGSGLTWEAALEQEATLQAEERENLYFLPLVTAE